MIRPYLIELITTYFHEFLLYITEKNREWFVSQKLQIAFTKYSSLTFFHNRWSKIIGQKQKYVIANLKFSQNLASFQICSTEIQIKRPIHLYLIFEKSCWKNQVRRFLVYFELHFIACVACHKSISKLIFAAIKSSSSNLIFQKSSTDGQGERTESFQLFSLLTEEA